MTRNIKCFSFSETTKDRQKKPWENTNNNKNERKEMYQVLVFLYGPWKSTKNPLQFVLFELKSLSFFTFYLGFSTLFTVFWVFWLFLFFCFLKSYCECDGSLCLRFSPLCRTIYSWKVKEIQIVGTFFKRSEKSCLKWTFFFWKCICFFGWTISFLIFQNAFNSWLKLILIFYSAANLKYMFETMCMLTKIG